MDTGKIGGNKRALYFGAPISALALLAALLLAFFSSGAGCGDDSKPTGKKVLIMGIDGMDPRLVRKFMEQGLMPNLSELMSRGDFKDLTSSIPPQSPVAWSNFITGAGPGTHGIYDFIHRDPDTYMPYLSTSKSENEDPDFAMTVGDHLLWLPEGETVLLRRGKPFWEYLAENGVWHRVFKIPSNYPPYEGKGYSGSGMGTPDLLGTYGTFTFFTEAPPDHPEEIGGGTIVPVSVTALGGDTTYVAARGAVFQGPTNVFRLDPRKPYSEYGGKKHYNFTDSEVPVDFYINRATKSVKIELQDQELLLKEGEWSEWVPIVFEMWSPFVEVHGIVRFYLKEVDPHFKLYASPINMDPTNPPQPITNPKKYGEELAADVGYYYTQGMPEDTKARQADLDILNDGELFDQMMLVHAEDMKLFRWHMDHWNDGLLFYYFSSLDLGTHMFWRLHDPEHPAYDPEWAEKLGDPVKQLYVMMDGVVGSAVEELKDPETGEIPDDTTLIVMSDHGFAAWDKSFQLNTWLLENGYLRLKRGVKQKDVEYFRGRDMDFAVDWSRTLAYGMGINGLYINLSGREKYGVVPPGEKIELVNELAEKLEEYVDPETGEKPLFEVAKSYEVFKGDALDVAPDIILGFKRGYRGGDDSALGKIPADIVTTNTSSWSGDHCIATREVPGIILSNRKIEKQEPALIDIGPTVLGIFGIDTPDSMEGKPLFKAD